MACDEVELGPLLEQLADQHPEGMLVIACSSEPEIVWASRHSKWTAPLSKQLDSAARTRLIAACREALTLRRRTHVDLGHERAIIAPLAGDQVAVYFSGRALAADGCAPQDGERFEMLLSQNVHGVFFMQLDEPFHWPTEASEQDVLLDYAFDHLRIAAVNDALCTQMNATRYQLLGAPPRARWSADATQWRDHMRSLYRQGFAFHSLKAPRGDGTWLDVEGEYICTYDDAGRITGHYGVQRDISLERYAMAELAKNRERLELAVVAADIGIWDADVTTRELYAAPEWMARFGYASGESWPSWDWWESKMHPDDAELVRAAFKAHFAGETPLFRAEYRLRDARGEWRWISSIGRLSHPSATRVVGIFVDISERKLLHARMAAAEQLAALGTLAAGVGHEINNPLAYVLLNLELMSRSLATHDDDHHMQLAAFVANATDGARRVSTIVRDLQSLARPRENGAGPTDPIKVLERCLQIAEHRIRHYARLICDLQPVPTVRGSEDRLLQVFLNLIVNAVQAIPEGAADHHWIRVATSHDAELVSVRISDNGAGIGADLVDRIFEPFFTTKDVGEGTGLGLTICASILNGLGGTINVETQLGGGSCFHVTIPIQVDDDAPRARAAQPAGSHPRRVLVIDDEPVLGELVKSALENVDVQFECTVSAALARLRSGEAFDRILCDVMMPELTGVDFYDALPEQLRPLVVFMTGGSFTERARSFLARIPNRQLKKPFGITQLTAALSI